MERIDSVDRMYYPLRADGRLDTSKRPKLKRYLTEMAGSAMKSIWTDIRPLNSQAKERRGYPTQKPEASLERIVSASSNPGDMVRDPMLWTQHRDLGCGDVASLGAVLAGLVKKEGI